MLELYANSVRHGFLLPERTASATERAATGVDIFVIPGVQAPVQFFRVPTRASITSPPTEALVIAAHHPRVHGAELTHLAQLVSARFPDKPLVFTSEVRVGYCRALATIPDVQLAAVVALVQVACGWDESNPIVVEIGGETFAITWRHVDHIWRATVATCEAPRSR